MDPKSPGHGSWIIDTHVPWIIIVSCSINNNSIVDITMSITRQISHINHFGGGLVNVCIFHIVNRRFRWQVIHFIRPFNTNFPGTSWFVRHEPDSIVDTVIYTVNQQNRFVRIQGIRHISALYIFKLGITIIFYFHCSFFSVDGGSLRNGLLQ